jgi:thiamine biosynthesis protein ThiI
MECKKIILVKYGEIALRKGNRALYERRVINAIRNNLSEYGGNIHVLREQGRFLIEDIRGDIDEKAVMPRIRHIFGITALCVGRVIEKGGLELIKQQALEFFKEHCGGATSFKVETKRGDKQYPVSSNDISAVVGRYILENIPNLSVRMKDASHTLWIEVRNNVYFYTYSVRGEGGLPYGSSGNGLLLLSGGLDSPVAGYLMARRGVEITAVYFHSPPYTSERTLDKVKDLASRLAKFTGGCNLLVVPFTDAQLFLYKNVQTEKLTILLKRAMLRIASCLASNGNIRCLITGDSIGQVASQTIYSLEAVNSAASLPVIRPLAAIDKQDIIETAKAIETYDISIRPYEDCCTLFVAEHPENKPKASVIEGIEKHLDEQLTPLISLAVKNAQAYKIR